MTSSAETERALGALYGQLIGDALGCRYEFKDCDTVRKLMSEDREANDGHLPIIGGGPFDVVSGQGTDDTAMTLCLVRSLVHCREYNAVDVACSYVHWAQNEPLDIGMTIHSAVSVGTSVPRNWRQALTDDQQRDVHREVRMRVDTVQWNMNSLSNGVLMRISPLAIAFRHATAEKLKEMVKEECLLTHSNPLVLEAAIIYVQAIASLLRGASVQEVQAQAEETSESALIRDILQRSRTEPTPVSLPNGQFTLGDDVSRGYFGVALQSAFYEMSHAKDFASGLEGAIARGGDTDTNGCIVGALLGARSGEDAIPQYWIADVQNNTSASLTFVMTSHAGRFVCGPVLVDM